jgi:hypothetical protein
MKKLLFPVSAIALAVHAYSVNALESLDDAAMSQVLGQAGITIEMNPGDLSVDEISYTQDGVSARMTDFNISGTPETASVMTVDIDADGTLNILDKLGSRPFSVGGVGMTGSTGISSDFFSMRGVTQGYNDAGTPTDYSDDTGIFKLNLGGENGNLKLDGTQVGLFFDSLHFGDDGLEWIIDDLVMAATINYGRLIVSNEGLELDFGNDRANPGLSLLYDAKAIGLAAAADVTPGGSGSIGNGDYWLGDTFGSLRVDLDAIGSLKINGGGKFGEGITFIPALTLFNDSVDGDDRPAFKYVDDGFVILAKGFEGNFSTGAGGLTLDFQEDENNNPYVSIQYSELTYSFELLDLVIGAEDGQSLGSFAGQVLFSDDVINNRTNYINIYPGGRIGTQGVKLDVGWNIVSADPDNVEVVDGDDYAVPGSFSGKTALESNSYFAMNDDDNWVMFNGFNGYGSGLVTLDLTAGARSSADVTVNATSNAIGGYYNNPFDSSTGTFAHIDADTGEYQSGVAYEGPYDGLRIGFENLKGEYSFAGVTVGSSKEEASEAAYMGGTELLLAMEIFPAYSFTLNGNLTIAPGGQLGGDGQPGGSQGLTLNGDLLVTDGSAALTVDETGRGVWLTGVTYDIHMRGASLDVTEDGLTFNKGLTWSTIKVGDASFNSSTRKWDLDGGIIFGSKDDGKNLGVFTLERLEDGTTIALASGGAGLVCIGGGNAYQTGSGAGDGGCAASDTNGNGVFDQDDAQVEKADYENRGKQGLTIKVNAKFAEGSDDPNSKYYGKGNRFSWTQPNGTTLTLDNFSTSDGPQGGNEYGLNIDLSLDVARTKVKNEAGNPLKLVDGEYKELVGDETYQEFGPLGFAVLGRVHFKQLNIDGLKLSATPDSTPQTLISQIVIQNADIQANLTATPIR